MRVTVFSSKPYDRQFLDAANAGAHVLDHVEPTLLSSTATLAQGSQAVCAFVNDDLGSDTLAALHDIGVRLVALRCAGFNRVDVRAAERLGMAIARVPAYSPHAIAEHTLALVLALNRRIHRAYNRVREGNFSLDGLLGFDLNGKTVGIVGTGKIGACAAAIFRGFNCTVLALDPHPDPGLQAAGIRYVDKDELLRSADIISLHCPLTPDTHHFMDESAFDRMKTGAMLVNTSRGAVVDAFAAKEALKSGQLGALALDVYEEEGDLFFRDLSSTVIRDDLFARLVGFPNVLITGHQAFFTQEAMLAIAQTTIANIDAFERDGSPLHSVNAAMLA
ncbi:MAG: 2-hydroxyacid dehydrogenase [Notoacmeibacter sp.]|nr:2-hydroxyacid dehydrogenase [Notoacmeibacter sp.]